MVGSTGISTRRAQALSQATLGAEVSRVSNADAAGHVLVSSPGAELAWSSAWSSGVNVPFMDVWPEEGAAAHGLGSVGVFSKWVVAGDVDQAWVIDWQLALPTQTVHLGLDPGPVLGFSSSALWSYAAPRWLVQTQLGGAGDVRRAGTALQLVGSVRVLYWIAPGLGLSGGLASQIRMLTWCSQSGNVELCDEGRASEIRTPTYATAQSGELSVELAIAASAGLRAAARVPLTERRDSDWVAQLSLALSF